MVPDEGDVFGEGNAAVEGDADGGGGIDVPWAGEGEREWGLGG